MSGKRVNFVPYPSVDESRDRLHRAGWSLGETCFGSTWQVDGVNGENRLLATGYSQAEAWHQGNAPGRGKWACWRQDACLKTKKRGAAVTVEIRCRR